MEWIVLLASFISLVMSIFALVKIENLEKNIEELSLRQFKLNKNNTQQYNNFNDGDVYTKDNSVQIAKKYGLSALQAQKQAGKEYSKYNYLSSRKGRSSFIFSFIHWLRQDFFMKIGAFFIFVASIWILIYFVKQNIIGPVTITTLGFVLSSLLILFGIKDAFTKRERGLVIFGLGTFLSLANLYAAIFYYSLISKGLGAVLLATILSFIVFTSWRFNSKALIFLASVIASFVPFLFAESTIPFYVLIAYFAVIATISSIIIWQKRWHFLNLVLFIEFVIYSIYIAEYNSLNSLQSAFIFIFPFTFMLNHITSLINIEKENRILNNETGKNIFKLAQFYSGLTALNIIFISLWTIAYFDYVHIILLGWAAITLFIALIAYVINRYILPFSIYGLSSLLFVAIIVLYEFGFLYLYPIVLLEAILTLFVVKALLKNELFIWQVSKFIVAILGLPALLYAFLLNWVNNFADYLFNVLLYLFALFLIVFYGRPRISNINTRFEFIVPIFVIFALIWTIPHSSYVVSMFDLTYDKASWVSVVIYTLLGVALYKNGFANESLNKILHGLGRLLLLFVTLWIIFKGFEISNILLKIALFIVVGVLLIYTAYKNKKND